MVLRQVHREAKPVRAHVRWALEAVRCTQGPAKELALGLAARVSSQSWTSAPTLTYSFTTSSTVSDGAMSSPTV